MLFILVKFNVSSGEKFQKQKIKLLENLVRNYHFTFDKGMKNLVKLVEIYENYLILFKFF